MNLFEKYGGTPTISKVVTNFYGKILSRPHLKAYFAGVPLPKLIQHQVRFMSQVMGQTPGTYNGKTMDEAHQRLNITAAHFGEVAQILETCLNEAGMAAEDLTAVMTAVASLQGAVVNPGRTPGA